MPCWEVRTMSVKFQAKHRKLLEKALDALGWDWIHEPNLNRLIVGDLGTIDLEKQTAEINKRDQYKLNQLKVQYSKEALRRAAKLQGWQLKTKGTKGVLRR